MTDTWPNLTKACGGAINPDTLTTFKLAMREYADFMGKAQEMFAEKEPSKFVPVWVEVTPEKYDEMLGMLPPAIQTGFGFLVGEASSHRECREIGRVLATYAAYIYTHGKYYACKEALTVHEFRRVVPAEIVFEMKIGERV
ncbi:MULTISPECIES: hypothetical protein [unclassified Bradyrhizobium]|uniref:hypothetical protein n=1 Tax=unclassified Bradyrhizobium TaxID=2631580 RepID=UPI0033996633